MRFAIAGLVAAGLLAGSSAAHGSQVVVIQRIAIGDDFFDPEGIELTEDEQVSWSNEGARAHTVTADDGSFDSGPLDPGESFTLDDPGGGTVRYHCSIHGAPGGEGMSGVLFVAASGATAGTPDADSGEGPARRLARTGSGEVPAGALAFLALALLALGAYLASYERLLFPGRR